MDITAFIVDTLAIMGLANLMNFTIDASVMQGLF